uniref:Chromosome 5 open reading frame 34 n=1 Tax=Cyanoderma ruficeps TaxID=181631 RepID=A0A8C3QTA8_9PASS
MEVERLMVLFADDSVEVHYEGGSRLLLSPCGSEYLYEAALPAAAHPLQPAETTRQRVAFVVSAYREQLLRALDFRNMFSSRPYLPSRVIPPERKKIFLSDILEIKWPDPATADLTRCLDNGIVKISSIDGYAHLYLSELQQEFTVEFLCKVSQSSAVCSRSAEKNSNYQRRDQCGKPSKNSAAEVSSKQRIESRNKHGYAEGKYKEATKPRDQRDGDGIPLFHTNCSSEYTWVTQRWTVSLCPEEWKYPLSLALKCCNLHTVENVIKAYEENSCTAVEGDVLADPETHEAVSSLPTALPLSCRAPHLHRWTFCDFFQNEDMENYSFSQLIQVVWCQGVFYRFIHGKTNITEIYPGDHSFFKSEGAFLGKYFIRYAIQKGTKKVEEKMYSVSSLPPDVPGHPYSISSIITQATKILQYCCKTKLSLSHNYYLCCWKMVSETDGREMLPVLLHEKVIPSIGRLTVYSDSKVHAVFLDRMTVTMVWDFSSSCSEIQINEDVGWCKLTTPDGLQQLIQISHPGVYERSADAEIEKIQRFNFLLDSSNILQRTPAAKCNSSGITVEKKEYGRETEELGEGCVLEALEKTSKVIQDIESLLAASGK